MSAKITRREAGLLFAAAAAAGAQTPQQPGPEADLETVRRRRGDAAASLAKVNVPIETGPAFIFRV